MRAPSFGPTEQLPVARTENLVSEEVLGEVVVYDLERHKAHSLNEAAARVWQLCDGAHSPAQIAAAMATRHALEPALAEPLVALALEQLQGAKLLEPGAFAQPRPALTRRAVLKRIGLGGAAVALPVIATLVAPTPAMAQSPDCGVIDAFCNTDADCCPTVPWSGSWCYTLKCHNDHTCYAAGTTAC